MPFFKIETNHQINAGDLQTLLKKTSGFISEMLGKPEQYVMVSIDSDKQMMFGGNASPAAFVQLKSIGLPSDRCAAFSESICGFLNHEFGIQPDRVFIDFKNLEGKMFGWNSKTF